MKYAGCFQTWYEILSVFWLKEIYLNHNMHANFSIQNHNLAIGEYVKDIYILLIIRFIFKGVIFILHLKNINSFQARISNETLLEPPPNL